MRRPDLRVAEALARAAGRSRGRAAPARGSTAPGDLARRCVDAAVPGRSEYGNTCRCVSGERSRYGASCSKSSSVSPGKPTMTSEPIDACGMRRADVVDERRVVRDRVRPPHRASIAVARVLQRQMEVRREAVDVARRDRRSRGVQSIGSSELMRNSDVGAVWLARVAVASTSARSSSISDDARRQIAAVRSEVHAGQRDLLEAGRDDAIDLAQHARRSARCAARRASPG